MYRNVLENGTIFLKHFLPSGLLVRDTETSKSTIRQINLISLILIFVLYFSLILTYAICLKRFDHLHRSFNFHPWTPAIIIIGGICTILYYQFNIKRAVYILLPFILIGGGFFLGIVSFAFELITPHVMFYANLSMIATVLTIHLLNLMNVLDRYPKLASILIFIGSCLMDLTLYYVTYELFMSVTFVQIPQFFVDPLGYELKTYALCLIIIFLMSVFALFHFDQIKKLGSQQMTFTDKLHIAANTVFIIFFLYLAFLTLITLSRKR
ncbi:MAG: hypothetical protein AB7I27_00125 [Bacteriovoracaceae bacterium]